MGSTKIEWAEKSWNIITGCSPVSAGCERCYARRMAHRIVAMEKGRLAKNPNTKLSGYPHDDPFRVTFHPDKLDAPLHWKKPRRVFVCSMSDLFHENIPGYYIRSVIATAALAEQHTFIILTKRPKRMLEIIMGKAHFAHGGIDEGDDDKLPWPLSNIWLGVSAENQRTADERIPILLQIPAAVRFVSVEPMLERVNVASWGWRNTSPYDPRINWVICGGESGPGRRPFKLDWARDLRDQCKAADVAFFMKQRDKVLPIPDDLMIREYPE